MKKWLAGIKYNSIKKFRNKQKSLIVCRKIKNLGINIKKTADFITFIHLNGYVVTVESRQTDLLSVIL